jgi:hypothetical protein
MQSQHIDLGQFGGFFSGDRGFVDVDPNRCVCQRSGVAILAFLASFGAQAQGVVGGAENGADRGNAVAGPVGAVVAGVVGEVTGGVDGLLGIDQRPRFHEYVVREHHPSYRYNEEVRAGAILPSDGIQYYDVPPEYGLHGYRYAVVNDQTVLVHPRTGRVVQIIN